MKRLGVVVALALVAGDEVGRLAPGPAELASSAAEAEARVARAEAMGVAAVRLQNAWGEALATGKAPKKPCEDEVARSLLARVVVFGPAWRDAAQSARAERDRLVEIAASPTVAPLVGADMALRIERLKGRVEAQETRYVEAVAWQRANMIAPSSCDLALAAWSGIDSPLPVPPDERVGVAVIGLGGGLVCPAGALADGKPVVTDGAACVTSAATCDCAPEPVAPAAVLGPSAR